MGLMKHYKYNEIPFIILISRMPVLLFTCWFILPNCQTGPPERRIREVDSLIGITLSLQKKISSQKVQVLNDFSYGIDNDLSFFYDTVKQQFPDFVLTHELEEYISLQEDIENCLSACKKYNEEVFLIENNLRDMLDRLYKNNGNPEELERLIETEKDLLDDLLSRIENNIGIIDRHIEEYLHLKLLIDTLKINFFSE